MGVPCCREHSIAAMEMAAHAANGLASSSRRARPFVPCRPAASQLSTKQRGAFASASVSISRSAGCKRILFQSRSALYQHRHVTRLQAKSALVEPTTADAAVDAQLLFENVVFDMDGTLTVSNIDFQRMRTLTGIPQGDLFTVMESWDDPDRIQAAYDVILELEAEACASLQLQPGLTELLSSLRSRRARLALVTRNTTVSVDAFFAMAGEHWRDDFSIILTREFRFVKPDKRLLLYVADQWGVPPSSLLMVGDSREDVECGNAAGAATCLIQGGGNEVVGSKPVAGAEPSFAVTSLSQLERHLLQADSPLPDPPASSAAAADCAADPSILSSSPSSSSSPSRSVPGLDFADHLFSLGIVRGAFCSFPRLAGAAGGISASTYPGDSVLHLGCGEGALTKLLGSQGLRVEGVEWDGEAVTAAVSRGLPVTQIFLDKQESTDGAHSLRSGSLGSTTSRDLVLHVIQQEREEEELAGATAAAVAERAESGASSSNGIIRRQKAQLTDADSLSEIWRVLKLGGHVAIAFNFPPSPASGSQQQRQLQATMADVASALEGKGFLLVDYGLNVRLGGVRLHFVARKPGLRS